MATNIPKLVAVKANGTTLASTPSLLQPAERHCTICLAQDQPGKPLMACGQCRGALYCSQECAQQNSGRHRKLCYKYKMATHPQDGNKVRVVHFPIGKPKPEIIFVDKSNWDTELEEMLYVGTQPLPFDLKIVFTASNAPTNTALMFCYNENWELPAPRFPWTGGITVIRTQSGTDVAEDLTMADFRDVLDFFVWYGHQFSPEMADYLHGYGMPGVAPQIQGVLIRCPATQNVFGEGALVPVMVDDLHPIRGLRTSNGIKVGEISPVTARLGCPVRMYNLPHPPLGTGKGRWECVLGDTKNSTAAELMVNLSTVEGATTASNDIPCIIGDILAVREDGQDLSIDEIVALCREVQHLITLSTKGDAKGKGLTPCASQDMEALQQQGLFPMGFTDRKASESTGSYPTSNKRNTIPDLLVDPVILPKATSSESVASPDVGPGQVDNSNAPKQAWQSERTLPSLWTKVKARRGDEVAGGPEDMGVHDMEVDGMEAEGLEVMEGTTEAEDENQPPSYEYPSPPPMRYTWSAEVIPEEELERIRLERYEWR